MGLKAMKAEQTVSGLRAELARFWLCTPAAELETHYAGDAGSLHKKFAVGCLKNILLNADERGLVEQVVNRIQAGVEGVELARFLLVAMLYLNAYELPPDLVVMKLPEWLRYDVFRFQLSFPSFLNHLGETEALCEHLHRQIARLHRAIIHQPQSPVWQQMAIIFAEEASIQPFYFSRRNLKPIAALRAAIVEYAKRLKRQDLDYDMPPRSEGSSRIRLGIHSWSLRPHTETFATLPLFEGLDLKQFEVYLYVHQSDGNPVEQRARRLAQRFTVLPEMLKACVEAIRADDLDILVFGNNITAGVGYAFSMANYRMARVQCIHFCNPVTSGKRHIDCFLLGKLIAANLDNDKYFSEQILTLEGSGICFDLSSEPPTETARGISRRDLGIPESSTVFISGANYFKIIPELRHTWAKILDQVPGSVLLLYPFGPAWSHHYPQQSLMGGITRVFDQYGIHSERLIVMDTLKGRGDILALNRIADIYLDAVPYNGATSLLDPLQEGVPPIVVDGRELRFAQGAAILRELGVPELIAGDEKGYIRLAVRLATDCGMREATRRLIREQMGRTPPFLNPRLYAARVSRAFRSLFPDVRPQRRPEASSQHASLILPG
jgi:predicted O-linked N-acetylglucosamine transferase (SPINDLY family)